MNKMNYSYDAFCADLPPERTRQFHSPEELESALNAAGVYQPTRQLSDGKFRAHLAVTQNQHANLFLDRYSTAISIYLEPSVEHVGFMFPRTASGDFIANGINISDEMLVAFPHRTGVDIAGPGLIGSDSIAVDASRFWSIADVACPGLERQDEAVFIPGDTKTLHALRGRLVELAAAPEPGPADLDVLRFIVDIIFWIGHSHEIWPTAFTDTAAARVRVARLAQNYIEAHYREAVHIEDLCRATRVGTRTLQRCFREYFQLTVSNYLKVVRLDSARRELAAADSTATSVTTIAMENGWKHLGRFSVNYREHFGESPSQTLAMQRRAWRRTTTPARNPALFAPPTTRLSKVPSHSG